MLIDTHCHLSAIVKNNLGTKLEQEDYQKVKNILIEAENNGVKKIIDVGTNIIESLNSIEIAKSNDNVFCSIGVHPNDCDTGWHNDIKELQKHIHDTNKLVAIGECGLDYHYPGFNKELQKNTFKAQIDLALENNLALIIHTRDAQDEVLKILDEFKCPELKGTIHCFSEGLAFAQDAVNMGFVLGIGGTVTYPKNEILRTVVKKIGLQNIILETDAPFLPPQYMRGKQNHPAQIKHIAEYVAELLQMPLNIVANTTTSNVIRIFKIK